MNKPVRPARYIALFFALLILSQIETACNEGGVAPSKQAASAPALNEADKGKPRAPGEAAPEQKRMVIVNRNLTVEVGDMPGAFAKVVALAEANGGYTVNTDQYQDPDGSRHGRVNMRVPTLNVPKALAEVRKLGKVINESSTGEDITEQYIDMEARLKNAKVSEERLLSMMQTRTGRLEDVLAVERELTRVRGEIESMEARKRNWDTLTETVEITVELKEPPRAMPALHKVWNPIKTAFGEAAEGFANSLHYAIVFVGAVIPWLVVLGVFGYIVVRVFRRLRKKKEQ